MNTCPLSFQEPGPPFIIERKIQIKNIKNPFNIHTTYEKKEEKRKSKEKKYTFYDVRKRLFHTFHDY